MTKNIKKPAVRFKEFTDAWEQRKFSELYTRSSEKNDGSIGIDRNITVATMQFKPDVIVTSEEYLKTYFTFNLGDIAFEGHQSKDFRYGRFVENNIGNGIVSHIFAVFRPITKYDILFWKYAINNERLMQNVLSRSTKASTMMHDLVTNDFFNEIFLVPGLEEQKRIGHLLDHLDNLITLHQRKCDTLQKLKKSMLQKMFPQNDKSVPEFRFEGFTDAWEQRELGSISEKVTKKNQDMVCDEVFTNSAEYGIISQRDFFDKDIANSENIDGYYIVEPNDFVYNPRISNLAPFGPIRRNKLEKSGAMSPLYYVFRTHGVDYGFLEYYFKTNGWHSFMHLNGNSGARSDRFAIRDDIFKEMPITIPQNIVEQQAVGKYFTNLDTLITLHQRKLETLKKLKKSMLQKMFV